MAKDFSPYKKLLDEEEVKLVEELGTVGRKNPENPDDWQGTPGGMLVDSADANEQADKVEDFIERSAIEAELEKQLELVKKAKQKIEDGGFGVCEIGGEEIEEDRLRANPASRTCISHIDTPVVAL